MRFQTYIDLPGLKFRETANGVHYKVGRANYVVEDNVYTYTIDTRTGVEFVSSHEFDSHEAADQRAFSRALTLARDMQRKDLQHPGGWC